MNEILVCVISALAGAIPTGWIVSWKASRRKANAEAALTEFELMKQHITLYDQRIKEKDERIASLEHDRTDDNEHSNAKIEELLNKVTELQTQLSEQATEIGRLRADNKCLRVQVEDVKKSLDKWRCWKAKTCPDREPPNKPTKAKTPKEDETPVKE